MEPPHDKRFTLLQATPDRIASYIARGRGPVDHDGTHFDFAVFNALNWPRRGEVELKLVFGESASAPPFEMLENALAKLCGEASASSETHEFHGQIFALGLDSEKVRTAIPTSMYLRRDEPDASAVVSIRFVVPDDIPPFGYKTYRYEPSHCRLKNKKNNGLPEWLTLKPEPRTRQNLLTEHWNITLAPGGIESLIDRESGIEFIDSSHYLFGEWMALNYTDNACSETRVHGEWARAPHVWPPSFETTTKTKTGGAVPVWREMPDEFFHVNSDSYAMITDAVVTLNGSKIRLELRLFKDLEEIALQLQILDWKSPFGVANRIVFPLKQRSDMIRYGGVMGEVAVRKNPNILAAAGVVSAIDADQWTLAPGPVAEWHRARGEKLSREWRMRPREMEDWALGGG